MRGNNTDTAVLASAPARNRFDRSERAAVFDDLGTLVTPATPSNVS